MLALAILLRLAHMPSHESADRSATPSHGEIIAAAKARIALESEQGLPPVASEAPPNIPRRAAMAPPLPVAPPEPPDGYTFVVHHGAMAKARMSEPPADLTDLTDAELRPSWLDLPGAVQQLSRQAEAAGRDWSFGWIRLAAHSRPADLALALAGTGAEVVGASGRMLRARLPADADRLLAIAGLEAVDSVGATPPRLKREAFADSPTAGPLVQVPAYITLMADDPDGRWRAAMEALGAVVGGYDPALRIYRANVDADAVAALAAADFVQAIEPIRIVQTAHDTAVPAMGADAMRAYDSARGVWAGFAGASVPIAVMDTGLNINHLDIASHRESICGANFAYNSGWFGPVGPLIEDEDLWIDAGMHGTHVTGTVAGNGFVQPRYAGMAPGVRHIRFAKVLDTYGFGWGDSIAQGMDYLATSSRCSDNGRMSEPAKPLIVNMSLSATARIFKGRDAGARKLDSTVWSHRQLYVVAQSNADINGFSNYGAAKNSLAVGAAMDDGTLASFSSHGPTADGRLAPNVVGTGVDLFSSEGDGSSGGYLSFSGTSMASPAVAGVAALLMDAVPAHKEQPALARARLMASAIRPDAWLADGAGFPLDNTAGPGPLQARFGMGKVSARTAALSRNRQDGWASGSGTAELANGEYAHHDIRVPAGASRLDVVMTWDEPPADTVASTVFNDLDLWLDRDRDCAAEACGEYASRSRVDNVEWIIVRNPEPGTYRAKVLAHRVYTAPPRAAVAWTVVRGPSTPTVAVEADQALLPGGEGEHDLTLTLTTDGYVAAGTRLHIDCRSIEGSPTCGQLLGIEGATVTTQGGLAAEHERIGLGSSIPIGELAAGDRRTVSLRVATWDGPGTVRGARLHLTASAWNARASSTPVSIGTLPDDAAAPRQPANDDFIAATGIGGPEGSVAVDLLAATPEPGEPPFDHWTGRPAGSVWFAWTAPADGPFRVWVSAPENDRLDVVRNDRIQIFLGSEVAALREVASGESGATFFAAKGHVYRLRIASSSGGTRMHLRWSPATRPANDDFADAVALDGESGTIDGTTAGATLQPGESVGGLAGTTWFRWTAPADGHWWFSTRHGVVMAFEGGRIDALRLVSGPPDGSIFFPAAEAREYRIAVAERGGASSGQRYTLEWGKEEHADLGNDAFAGAQAIDAGLAEQVVDVDGQATVEPGEPPETGVRTKWWSWDAPRDGLHTWRIADQGEVVPSYPKLRLTMFKGQSLRDLELVAESGPGAPFEFLLDTTAGERYLIAAGLGNGHAAAYESWEASGKLVWGATPANDEAAGAAALAGAAGSMATSSTAFATSGRGERSGILGRATLWWTYEAPASGWVRFAAEGDGGPWALTVHRPAADGFGGLDIVASSHWQRAEDEVVFRAKAGARYKIALGVKGAGTGGEFTLRWDEADDPGWLGYAGRLADGFPDSTGIPVQIRSPGSMVAVNATSSALYVASELGLQVFEPSAATGRLRFVQSLATDLDLSSASLLWDAQRNRLLADDCGAWRSFGRVGGGPELAELGSLSAGDAGACGNDLVAAPDGSTVYRIGDYAIDQLAVEADGRLRLVESTSADYIVRAVLSNDGRYLYAARPSALTVYERDLDTGRLTSTEVAPSISAPHRRAPLAITDDDMHLFVFDNSGEQVNLFALEDPSKPERLATLSSSWDRWESNACVFADARSRGVAVDVFCPDLAFAARWDAEAGELVGSDFVSHWQADRSNRVPPPFGVPAGFAASADDRRLYVSTAHHGILIFDRRLSGDETPPEAPDLIVGQPSVDETEPAPGATIAFSATVRNRGGLASAATTLRLYRSANASISTDDTEVGTVAVPGIDPSRASQHAASSEAPTAPGIYYYGACVDSVPKEADTGNNCSPGVAIVLPHPGDQGPSDLVLDAPTASASDVAAGASFTLDVTVRNRGPGLAPATTLRYYRSGNATISRIDTGVGTDHVSELPAGGASGLSVEASAPNEGAHYYGACIDAVQGESDPDNNCSDAVVVRVVPPDLVVDGESVDTGTVEPGGSFSLTMTVRNQGDGLAGPTTLRYYQSADRDIATDDVEVATATIGRLAPTASTQETTHLAAPSIPGIYYYGGCVDPARGESAIGNNCTQSVRLRVGDTDAVGFERPTITSTPIRDQDGDGEPDTYGPTERVAIQLSTSESGCRPWPHSLQLTFETPGMPGRLRTVFSSKRCSSGASGATFYFYYIIAPGDVDGDGLSIAANSIRFHDDSLTGEHPALPAQGQHRVDGSLADIHAPRAVAGVHWGGGPADGRTFRRGESIWATLRFNEDVLVDASGGVPSIGVELGDEIRRAQYVADRSTGDTLFFEYVVQSGDRDDDGEIWFPEDSLVVPPGSSIADSAGNQALTEFEREGYGGYYVDGSSDAGSSSANQHDVTGGRPASGGR